MPGIIPKFWSLVLAALMHKIVYYTSYTMIHETVWMLNALTNFFKSE